MKNGSNFDISELTEADFTPPDFTRIAYLTGQLTDTVGRQDDALKFDTFLDSQTPEFIQFRDDLLSQFPKTYVLNRCQPAKLRTSLSVVLANLIRALNFHPQMWLGTSRNQNDYLRRYAGPLCSYRSLVGLLDTLVAMRLIEQRNGYHSPNPRECYRTRIRATDHLIHRVMASNAINSELARLPIPHELVVLKDEKGQPKNYKETAKTKGMRRLLERYNSQLQRTDISVAPTWPHARPVLTRNAVHRVFNNGSFKQGGRFYGAWWMECLKETRQFITINGIPTIELDFQSLVLHQAYARRGLYYHDFFGEEDPYSVDEYNHLPRPLRKTGFMVRLNCPSRAAASWALTKEDGKKHLNNTAHRYSPIALIKAIEAKHHRIFKTFDTNAGLRLQYDDSCMAEQIIRRTLGNRLVVLTIHDSFIVEIGQEAWLRSEMESAWRLEYPHCLGFPRIASTQPGISDARTNGHAA